MARRIAQNTLNASSVDILNVIRQNATYAYQQAVPIAEKSADIPKVGEIIYGTPAFANEFLNAVINRIAAVKLQSANFNNPFSVLKKGYIDFGETIEEIFVGLTKSIDYSAEKAESREFKRSLPDVKSAFHAINWRVMYPVTVQDEDLRMAFTSADGVTSLVTKIIEQVYTAAEYDEFLLFKYLLIKALAHGQIGSVSVGNPDDIKDAAVMFRGISNRLTLMSRKYNASAVNTTTPKSRQVIFMDSMFNAEFDVNVLASAFNMDKADFMGRLFLIDDWTEFDNERFEVILRYSDGLEEVTRDELNLLKNVKAVILDENWFQVYDNANKLTEKYVASGMYWNYFYHTWKTVSSSPFANAVAFVSQGTDIQLPETITMAISGKDESETAITLTVALEDSNTLQPHGLNLIQDSVDATNGIAIQPFGAVIIPIDKIDTQITLKGVIPGEWMYDTLYTATSTISGRSPVNTTISFSKSEI